jgi:hypothetical protein
VCAEVENLEAHMHELATSRREAANQAAEKEAADFAAAETARLVAEAKVARQEEQRALLVAEAETARLAAEIEAQERVVAARLVAASEAADAAAQEKAARKKAWLKAEEERASLAEATRLAEAERQALQAAEAGAARLRAEREAAEVVAAAESARIAEEELAARRAEEAEVARESAELWRVLADKAAVRIQANWRGVSLRRALVAAITGSDTLMHLGPLVFVDADGFDSEKPLPESSVAEMVQRGEIDPLATFWRAGMADWESARDFPWSPQDGVGGAAAPSTLPVNDVNLELVETVHDDASGVDDFEAELRLLEQMMS